MRRIGDGIQTHDYALDIVGAAGFVVGMEGRDEFEELSSRGFFTGEQAASIRAEADRVVKVIESCSPPFRDGWEDWRPDQSWPVPRLPDNWAEIIQATAR